MLSVNREGVVLKFYLGVAKVLALVPFLHTKRSRFSRSYVLFFYAPFFAYMIVRYGPWSSEKAELRTSKAITNSALAVIHLNLLTAQLYGAVSSRLYWKKLLKNLYWHDASLGNTLFNEINIRCRVFIPVLCLIFVICFTIYGNLKENPYTSTTLVILFCIKEVVILIQTFLMSTIIYELCDLLKKRYDHLTHVANELMEASSRFENNIMEKQNGNLIQGTSLKTIRWQFKIGRIRYMYRILHATVEQFNSIFGKYVLSSFFSAFTDIIMVPNIFLGDHSVDFDGVCWGLGRVIIKWVNNIEDEKKKKSILLICCDEGAYKLLENLCIPNSPEEKSFEEQITLLDEHSKPVQCSFAETQNLYAANKSSEELVKRHVSRD
ncbi:hypothetical protein JTB14_009399 [Gonioctena quinquepunctata]|nr:hypothetical protein JTB14_009399 [Gonioctena quinquepunctata]